MQRLVSVRKSRILRKGFLFILYLFLLFFIFVSSGDAYYGLSGLGLYGGMYGGLGLYGLGGLYGMGLYGLGGLNSFGGLYGIGLYGLGGLNSLGGLYGLSGLCNPFGFGGLYGLGGFCGIGGLYGMGSLYGLGGMACGIGGLGGLLGNIGLLSNLGPASMGIKNTPQPAPIVTAEQAGSWTGTWTSLVTLKTGLMQMTLVEDTLTGTLSGEVNLILNKVTNSIPADVTGYYAAISPGSLGITGTGGAIATFVLAGGNQSFFSTSLLIIPILPSAISIYTIKLVCIMTSPVTMIGTYDVQDLYKLEVDSGEFELTLTAPII